MKALYVCSTSEYSGKSLLCLGLASRFRDDGFKIGYFKPLGKRPMVAEDILTDHDAQFFKEKFELKEPLSIICPVVLTHDLAIEKLTGKGGDLKKQIRRAYQEVVKDKDILLIGGASNLYDGAFLGIPGLALAKAFDWPVLLIDRYFQEICLDGILAASTDLKKRLLAAVLNQVVEGSRGYLQELVVPFLEKENIPVLGILPHDDLLASVTVEQLKESLAGTLLCREDKLGELVAHFAIGAMDAEHALRHFLKIRDKAIITGGDRPDIQSAALESTAKCLVLTGGFSPNEMILAKAREIGVPIITVKYDTLTAVEKIEALMGKVGIREERKLARLKEIMAEEFNFARLYSLMGLR